MRTLFTTTFVFTLTALVLVGQANAATIIKLHADPQFVEQGAGNRTTVCGFPVGVNENSIRIFGEDEVTPVASISEEDLRGGCLTGMVKIHPNAKGETILKFKVGGKEMQSQKGAITIVVDLRAYRLLSGSRPASVANENEFRSFLKGVAQGCGMGEKELTSLLDSPKPGTSQQAVDRIQDCWQKKVIAAALADPRMRPAQSGNSGQSFDPRPVYDRLQKVEGNVNDLKVGQNAIVTRLGEDEVRYGQRIDRLEETVRKTAHLTWDLATTDLDHMSSKTAKSSNACAVLQDMKGMGEVHLTADVCGEKGEKKEKHKKDKKEEKR